MKKKGFTLVELLGVIVVLAIIALIAVPTIIGIIEKSRKGSLQNSGYGLVEAGTLYNAQYQNGSTVRFDIKDNEVTSKEENKLSYKGSIKEGTVLINNKGQVVICINDGKYAAYKNFKDNKVTIVDNKTCTIPENSNIVYLDNESTIDISNEELLSRIEALEKENKSQKEEIERLKENQSNQTDITNSIHNLTTSHNTDMALLNNKLGNTNISAIGNGTITGAINDLESKQLRRSLSKDDDTAGVIQYRGFADSVNDMLNSGIYKVTDKTRDIPLNEGYGIVLVINATDSTGSAENAWIKQIYFPNVGTTYFYIRQNINYTKDGFSNWSRYSYEY